MEVELVSDTQPVISQSERESIALSEVQAVLARHECQFQLTLMIIGKSGTLFPYTGDEVTGKIQVKAI